jgi:hypothetical protein
MENAVLLLPAYGLIHRPHIDSLIAAGCDTIYLHNSACIDQARCLLVQRGLESNKDVFVFVDSDISFTKQDLLQLIKDCNDTKEIVTGIYVSKYGNNQMVLTVAPGVTTQRDDGLLPINACGMGFCAIHRNALQKIAGQMDRVKLPTGEETEDIYPFYFPMILDGLWLGEDYSFCQRAKEALVTIYLNHTIQVTHWGMRPHKFDPTKPQGVQKAS